MTETNEDYPMSELEKWIEVHGARLFLYARQQTQTHADAQDVYQEALIQVIKRCKKEKLRFVPPIRDFFVSIKCRAIDLYRQQKRRQAREDKSVETEKVIQGGDWFVSKIEKDEVSQHLVEALSELPEEQKEVVLLKIWGEQTFQAIGEITRVSANTAASRYRYALTQLKSLVNLQAI